MIGFYINLFAAAMAAKLLASQAMGLFEALENIYIVKYTLNKAENYRTIYVEKSETNIGQKLHAKLRNDAENRWHTISMAAGASKIYIIQEYIPNARSVILDLTSSKKVIDKYYFKGYGLRGCSAIHVTRVDISPVFSAKSLIFDKEVDPYHLQEYSRPSTYFNFIDTVTTINSGDRPVLTFTAASRHMALSGKLRREKLFRGDDLKISTISLCPSKFAFFVASPSDAYRAYYYYARDFYKVMYKVEAAIKDKKLYLSTITRLNGNWFAILDNDIDTNDSRYFRYYATEAEMEKNISLEIENGFTPVQIFISSRGGI